MSLIVRTTCLSASDDLLDHLPKEHPLAWVRRGEGLVAWGRAAEIRTAGPTRFSDAGKWFTELAARTEVTDEVDEPGTGLVAFGAFGFADDPGHSTLIVPEMVIGRRGATTWITTVNDSLQPMPEPVTPLPDLAWSDGALGRGAWLETVRAAVTRIQEGHLDKVVLARDLIATSPDPIDVRGPLRRLAAEYPNTWTFHVDGLFGATPELLVRRERGLVTSRILAGTIRRTGDDAQDLALAAALARSSKDLEEHEYAVESVASALEAHCSSMNVPEAPYVLHLPNVMHLATDVTGVAHDASTALELAASLHPSAAVGGTPTDKALALITELEGMGRERYAGPVGWIDATGDGEWGIALRSAQITGNQVRLFAGCGIVGSSDAEAEWIESEAKFVPVRDALGG